MRQPDASTKFGALTKVHKDTFVVYRNMHDLAFQGRHVDLAISKGFVANIVGVVVYYWIPKLIWLGSWGQQHA